MASDGLTSVHYPHSPPDSEALENVTLTSPAYMTRVRNAAPTLGRREVNKPEVRLQWL